MPDRLSPLDASFLYLEGATTPMHVGAVMTFDPPADGRFDVDAFVELIGRRLHLVPRYRQKVREVPGRLGLPVWVDDPQFDLHHHVRRSALPRPGTDAQLRDLVGRLVARRLDRARPLWEVHVVEGLACARVAILTKIHHAMVDGLASMDIGAVLLDLTPEPRATDDPGWAPAREPSGLELAGSAVVDVLRRPRTAVDLAARAVADLRETATTVRRTVAGVVEATLAAGASPVHPLTAGPGQHRCYATARLPLAEHRRVRSAHGGTVNDVVLAVVAGALRRWMIGRGEPLTAATAVRALVPVSVRARRPRGGPAGSGGNQISAYFVELPVGEPQPAARLARVAAAMEAHKRSGQAVGATALVGLVGLAPPTVHSLGARLTGQFSGRLYNVLVTNVPGPPRPLYARGARMREMYPVTPLGGGQAVSIGITSYDSALHYGITADRDAVPDADLLAAATAESLAELVAASDGGPPAV